MPPEDEKLYVGAKIIRAYPMDYFTHLTETGSDVSDHDPKENREGYCVIYPDGYKSWSPKETFENAYREVTQGEKELF